MDTLFLLGDSVLKGVTYSEENNKYKLVKRQRLADLSSENIDVCNLSHFGATISKGYDTLLKHLPSDSYGTSIVFSFGGNDSDYRWSDIAEFPAEKHLPNTPMSIFRSTYEKAVNLAKSCGAEVYITNLVPINADSYFDWICKGKNAENILSWLGSKDMLYRWHEQYNRIVEDIARDTDSKLIDIRTPFLLSHSYTSLMSADGIHPSVEGQHIVENQIVHFFESSFLYPPEYCEELSCCS